MSRRLIAAALGGVLTGWAGLAQANQEGGDPTPMPAADPIGDPTVDSTGDAPSSEPGAASPSDIVEGEPAGNQELGASLGLAIGGHISPGGLHLAGAYLYRLSDVDWFEGRVGFSFGGGDPACFRDRKDAYTCAHSALDGFATDVMIGIRRFFGGRGEFRPYAHGGVAGRVASYADDDVLGFGVAGWIGGGVRARVADGVAVGGGGRLLVGPAWFDQGLGLELQATFTISAGVEFQLD